MQEIHAKIMSLGFEDCKVYISNVDCQSSAEGGILVQVIGELSNRGGPWRKFVQTFFLAEQHAGFFVLNDVRRFIKDEGEEEEDDEPVPVAPPAVLVAPAPVEPAASVEIAPPNSSLEVEAPVEAPAAPIEPVVQTNGVTHDAPLSPVSLPSPPLQIEPVAVVTPPQPVVAAPAPVPVVVEPIVEPEPVAPAPPPVVEEIPSLPSTSTLPQEAAPPAPAVRFPATPKSWADLAGKDKGKWGAAAVASKGVLSATLPAPPPVVERAAPAPATKPQYSPSVMAVNISACFVKGVVETVNEKALRDLLTARFGPLKEFEVVRNKACAFLDFERVDGARKAIQACLRVADGGEGGIYIGEDLMHIVTKKAAADRPAPTGRTGGEGRPPRQSGGNTSAGATAGQGNTGKQTGGAPVKTDEAVPKPKSGGGNRGGGNRKTKVNPSSTPGK